MPGPDQGLSDSVSGMGQWNEHPVHVIRDQVYAIAIRSRATDYRYAMRQCGKPARLREVRLNDDLSQKCVQLVRSAGLVFGGIDLKITPDDRVYCFEVNPNPGFSFFEYHSGQPISKGLALCPVDSDRRCS